ncbi:MAG: CCA tRNA nucleotidyltransferase [Rhodospirillaceae bacterium]|nr:CCA tRNA nucleotidyltransferase [Rhodospirillaceae bacterium]
MKPVEKIPLQPWMSAAETRQVLEALTAGGGEARFVGGCVRDAALGRGAKDIDIATPLVPEEVTRRLEAAGIKVVPTGIEHGTVTAVVAHRPYEITTLRRDVETYGRHAKVSFTDDWQADAARRDFTMNALSCRANGEVFDYFGGLKDLRNGRVRFVGDPAERIREDVLRLLRFYRFVAHYGRGAPDAAARTACRAMAESLPGLSGERLRDETLKLLSAPSPHDVLVLMHNDRVLSAYLPEATEIERVARLVALERRWGVRVHAGDPLRRLALLLRYPAHVITVANRLRLSNKDRQRLEALRAPEPAFAPPADEREVRRLCYQLGPRLLIDRALLHWATEPDPDNAAIERILDGTEAWEPVALPVSGEDVLALGVPTGAAVGFALHRVEEWWMEADFRPQRDEALAVLRRVVGPRPAADPPVQHMKRGEDR